MTLKLTDLNTNIQQITKKLFWFIVSFYVLIFAYLAVFLLVQDPVKTVYNDNRNVTRAQILDRYGYPLAINQPKYSVSLRYSDLYAITRYKKVRLENNNVIKTYPRAEYVHSLCQFISNITGIETSELATRIQTECVYRPYHTVTILDDITEEQYFQFMFHQKDWPGLYVTELMERVYPFREMASHITGYAKNDTSKLNSFEDDIHILLSMIASETDVEVKELLQHELNNTEQNKRRAEKLKGVCGIESVYDKQLNRYDKPDETNNDYTESLVLSLSAELQEYTYELLHNESVKYNDDDHIFNGSITAMDAKTGAILAMSSYPGYDSNIFTKGDDANEINTLLENGHYFKKNGLVVLKMISSLIVGICF